MVLLSHHVAYDGRRHRPIIEQVVAVLHIPVEQLYTIKGQTFSRPLSKKW